MLRITMLKVHTRIHPTQGTCMYLELGDAEHGDAKHGDAEHGDAEPMQAAPWTPYY
jgi:hypothetical protein